MRRPTRSNAEEVLADDPRLSGVLGHAERVAAMLAVAERVKTAERREIRRPEKRPLRVAS